MGEKSSESLSRASAKIVPVAAVHAQFFQDQYDLFHALKIVQRVVGEYVADARQRRLDASLPLSDEREEERIVRVEDEEELLRRLMLSFSF